MNFNKKGPYILIILLIIILIFILGVQYGKRIKIADTAISILLSITPTPKPTSLPMTNYTSYLHSGCKVSFLYPSYLKLESESSEEAKFISTDKKQFVLLQCLKKNSELKESTNSANINIDGFRAQLLDSKNNIKIIRINKPSPVEFQINKELEPLIRTSIQLNP